MLSSMSGRRPLKLLKDKSLRYHHSKQSSGWQVLSHNCSYWGVTNQIMSELQNFKVNFSLFNICLDVNRDDYLTWTNSSQSNRFWRLENAYAETMWCRYCKKSGGTPPENLLRERFIVCMVWNDIVLFSGSPPDRLLSLRSLQLRQCTKKLTIFWKNKLKNKIYILIT